DRKKCPLRSRQLNIALFLGVSLRRGRVLTQAGDMTMAVSAPRSRAAGVADVFQQSRCAAITMRTVPFLSGVFCNAHA
ncbi:hypothetical protein ACNRC9_08405, partial [Ralstonia pseudosolanacearum]|uniref:hypothetical protein n=1 Tax=Ralstonia pseudosolanacearum TaxID=1310165 RepID=UPI003AAD3AA5